MWLPVYMPMWWKWGNRRLPVMGSLHECICDIYDLCWFSCVHFTVYLVILKYRDVYLSCLFLCACLGDFSSPRFLLCRWYFVCLQWAMTFVLGPVDSQPLYNAPPSTGSIHGPLMLYSQSAIGSSKRLKALRSGLWTHVLYVTVFLILIAKSEFN